MLSCFKGSLQEEEEEERSSFFLENGSSLLEELVGSFSGRYKNPIRSFTAKELITATNNFTDRELLIRDDGKIFRGFLGKNPILVKKFSEKCISYRTFYGAIRDIAVTSQMSHLKNVLKLRGCCLELKFPALVYEYAGNELLNDLLYNSDSTKKILTLKNRLQIGKGIANAIAYLNSAFPTTIVYRNLKPSKVIIDKSGIPKLFDFSLSIPLPPGESQVEDVMGTWGYVDPEYVETGIVTDKTDTYSFGVLLLLLLTGKEVMSMNIGGIGGKIHIVDYVKYHVQDGHFSCILDPKMPFDKDVNQEKQLHCLFNLAMECTKSRGEDRPDMISVAKRLYTIDQGSFGHC